MGDRETDAEKDLDRLFQVYREACPEPEPGVNFMPAIWQRIEARQGFWAMFQRFGRSVTAACAALCFLLLVLNLVFTPSSYNPAATYTDALMAEHSAEKTYYAEAIRNSSDSLPAAPAAH